jgi:hypothetical protein
MDKKAFWKGCCRWYSRGYRIGKRFKTAFDVQLSGFNHPTRERHGESITLSFWEGFNDYHKDHSQLKRKI